MRYFAINVFTEIFLAASPTLYLPRDFIIYVYRKERICNFHQQLRTDKIVPCVVLKAQIKSQGANHEVKLLCANYHCLDVYSPPSSIFVPFLWGLGKCYRRSQIFHVPLTYFSTMGGLNHTKLQSFSEYLHVLDMPL